MYLHKIKIENIRSIKKFELAFDPKESAGWHVVIGDNGAGKSSLVRAIALGLVGPTEAIALRQPWAEWLRNEESEGKIELQIGYDSKRDKLTGSGGKTTQFIQANLYFQKKSSHRSSVVLEPEKKPNPDPNRYLWGIGTGWFSASYGPFRRFTGSDREYERLFHSNPRLAPHLSVFWRKCRLDGMPFLAKRFTYQAVGT